MSRACPSSRGEQLSQIHPPLASLLAELEASLRRVWEAEPRFLADAARRVLSGRGKRLRPCLLLLCAECAGGATASSVALATVVELAHTASLIHDDVVDDSASRRGRQSAKALWGNKISVLLGDYLIARAIELLPAHDQERFMSHLARAVSRMCDGQIRELQSNGRPTSEAQYLEMVRAKTGALFGFCGEAGGLSAGGSAELAGALGEYGERFGVAFQLADDILDLVGTDGRSGKPEGRDLCERRLTLPLILAARRGGPPVQARLTRLLQAEAISRPELTAAREIAAATQATEAAWARVREYLQAAGDRLDVVPDGPAKQALLALAGEQFPLPVMA